MKSLQPTNRLNRGSLLYWTALFTISAAAMHFFGGLAQLPHSALLVVLLLGLSVVQATIAVVVVVAPTRLTLLAATVIEVVAVVGWFVARTIGIPLGLTMWRPELLNVPDLYLPALEGISACFFLCLFGRTWLTKTTQGAWRLILMMLPTLLMLGLLIWAVVNFNLAEILIAIFILAAGLPNSLLMLFLPALGLLALLGLLGLFVGRVRPMMKGKWRMAVVLLPALLIVNILIWTGSVNAANTAWFPVTGPVSASAGQTTTLSYCSPGGSPLAMDLSEPATPSARPAPVVFFIHGGEGLLGYRTLDDGSLDGMYFMQLRQELLNRGFVVGSIDYGLAPQHKLLEQVQDAKCAVRFLRAHASELRIDPQRMGVYGVSQGGFLASMLGTAGPEAGYDVGQYVNQSSRVQAVVDMWGFTDLANFSGSPSWVSAIGKAQSGGSKGTALKSPVNLVAANDPPFLIIHGADDWFIAPHHSQELAQRLHAVGVPATLVLVKNDGHGLAVPTSGKIEQPSPATLIQMIRDFFVRTLAA